MVEGETAKMQCKVKNPKNYPITWYRNGEEIKVPSDKFVTLIFFSPLFRLSFPCVDIVHHFRLLLTTLVVQVEQWVWCVCVYRVTFD